MMLSKRNLILIIAILGGLLLVVGLILALMTNFGRKDNIQVTTSPSNATIKLGDTQLTSGTATYVKPGQYELSVTAENFSTEKKQITVTDDPQNLVYCLQPLTTTKDDYFLKHPNDRYICEGAIGKEFNQEAQAAIKKNPIIAQLPYEDGTFAVGQGLVGNNDVALYVHYSSPTSKDEALTWIHHYQTNDLPPIVYTDDYQQVNRLGGIDSPLDKILVAKYPIVTALPIDDVFYRVGYRIDQSDLSGHSIKLTISSDSAAGRLAALRRIASLGYNPTDFKIDFINFESDLK